MGDTKSETVTFYYNPMSRARIAHWMLEESGAPYEIKLMDWTTGAHKAPEYLKINPMGKLPAIVHRGVVVTEGAAICAYLADAFPARQLAPPIDSPLRGTYLRWLFFAASCVEAATTDRSFPRVAEAKAGFLGYGTYDDTMNTLEKAITPGPFILGDHFSAADVYVASHIAWGLFTKTIDPRPAFEKYLANCQARPAFKRSEEQANAFLEKAKT